MAVHPSRKRYLVAIEENILSNLGKSDFRYVRICNVSRADAQAPLSRYLDRESLEHLQRVFEIQRRHDSQSSSGSPLHISVVKVPTMLLISYMVVDGHKFAIELNGLNVRGDSYAAGIFFMNDKSGYTADRLKRHFERMVDEATPVRREELVLYQETPQQ